MVKCYQLNVCMIGDIADSIGCRTPECPPVASRGSVDIGALMSNRKEEGKNGFLEEIK
jgi:hypothetical protein